ncbi:MAG: hypothetical protein ACD_60C00029G0010 [uncultured bacterium]|nr:MAG: hypothetical protein ACD_60C00029G0010 [uncultured bacterium]
MSSNDERIAVLETTISHIDTSLIEIKQDIKTLTESTRQEMKSMNEKMDSRFDKMNDRLWNLFFWMIAGFASTLGIVAHALHWI